MWNALRNLGATNAMLQNYSEALKYFLQAYQYAPNDATINLYIGQVYRDSGSPDKAQPYLDRAYQLNPALRK